MAAAFVQATVNTATTGTTVSTTAFAGSTISGNDILVAIYFDDSAGARTLSTVTDSKGNAYTLAGTNFRDSNGNAGQHAYSLNIIGGASHTVSANFAGGGIAFARIIAHEVSGLANSSGLDQVSAGNQATATSITSTSVTTTTDGQYIFASALNGGGTATDVLSASAPFTEPTGSTAIPASNEGMASYYVQPTAGAITATSTRPSSGLMQTRVTTYKTASASLPVTVAGISTAVAPVGPFKCSPTTTFSLVNPGATTNVVGSSVSTAARSQTFTVPVGGTTVNSINFTDLTKNGSPADGLKLDIYAVDGTQKPIGSSLGTSTTVAGSTITTIDAAYDFTFTTPVSVSAGTQYAVVISRTGAVDSSNYYRVVSGSTDAAAAEKNSIYNSSTATWSSPLSFDLPLVVTIGKGDAYYLFGRDSVTATTLQAYKSAAPDTSWTSLAAKTGFATGIQNISAYQVGTVIHMCITDGATTSINHKYQTFDASTDTFVTAETINSALNTTTSASANAYGTAIVVRSTAEVVVHYQAARISTFAQTAYRRRTGVATWAAGVAVSTTGVNAINPFVVLGASDRLHFLWFNSTNTIQRHLTSANVLGTAASTGATATVQDVATWNDAGTIRFVGLTATSAFRWNSADNPTVTNAAVTLGTPVRTADTAGVFYVLYQSSADSDLYIKTSSDNGATWGTAISEFVGTVASADANLSKNQTIYTRGSATVFPYIVNDNGTLKYDEYPISAGVTNYTMPVTVGTLTAAGQTVIPRVTIPIPLDADLTLAGQTVALQIARKTVAGLGTLAAAGQPVTLRYTRAPVVAGLGTLTLSGQAVGLTYGRKMPAGLGTLTLAGQVTALRATRTTPAGLGQLTLSGQTVVPRVALPVTTGTLTLGGQAVALRVTRQLAAGLGTLTLAGQNAVLTEKNSYGLIASHGMATLAGQDVALRNVRKLTAGQGTLTLAGQVVGLPAAHIMTAGTGTIILSGGAGWQTTFSQALATTSASWNGYNLRQVVNASRLSSGGTRVRCTLKAAPGSGFTIDAAEIGHQAGAGDPYDFDGTQVPLTFAGSAGVVVGAGSTGLSDAATYTLDNTKNFIVAVHFSAASQISTQGGLTPAVGYYFKLAANEVTTANVTGYSTTASSVALVTSIETETAATQLRVGRAAPAGQGTLTPSGQNVTLRYSRKMPAGLGTLTLAGQTVNTIYSGAGAKLLPAGLGTITLSGQIATLRYARRMAADTGTLTLSGQDVALTKFTPITHYSMPAASGTLTLAGQAATLTKTGAVTHYRLAVEHGTLTIDGQPVIVRYAHRMAAGVGVLTVSGQTVTLDTTAPATFSTLTLSGRDVTLRKINKLRMLADAGTLTLSGQALTLRRSRVPMAAALGTLTLSGRPIALPKGRMLAAGVGSIVFTGKAAGLAYKVQIKMAAEPGILHLVEQEVTLSRTTIPPVIRHETLRFGRSVYVSRW